MSSAATVAAGAPLERSLRPVLRPGPGQRKVLPKAPSAQDIIAAAKLDGRVCFAVADAQRGTHLEGSNGKTGIPPASVAKAITALYGLDTLGGDYRFETQLVATGPVAGGVLQGDLVLVGGGDPTLDTDGLGALAKSLKELGVREVTGAFIVADGVFPHVHTIDRGQPDHVGYSPAVSGIALNYNRVHFEWKRAGNDYAITMQARTKRYRPDVIMAQMRLADRRVPVYTYQDTGQRDVWSVARSALGRNGARWLPVRKPALYAGDVFQALARSEGIRLKSPKIQRETPQGRVLARHTSEPLYEILRGMLRYSTNLTAEMVGFAATTKRLGRAGSLRSSAREMSLWAERTLGAQGTALVDHSGLGDASRMTAEGMVAALVSVHRDGRLAPILKSFELRDSKGRPQKNHPIKVSAKTGTLNFVSGLAGYMTARDGSVKAFAIFAADEARRARISKANREAPQGARSWNRRAKTMQQKLIERWNAVYGA